jgi:23S rRNA pseudouridine1911/1915/1917 synthase
MDIEGIPILYQSDEVLAVNKPAGIATLAAPGIDSLEVRLRRYLAGKNGLPVVPETKVYLGMPHRLDRPVTGVVIFGKTRRATRRLARQFERRQIRKIYWAAVEGQVEPEEGTWHDLIRKVPDEPRAEIATSEHPDAQIAVLHYRVRRYFAWGSWLEIELETGRFHQIRIQAASRGHPVIGDFLYGSTRSFGPELEDWRLRPIALHARSLHFVEPITQLPMHLVAPLWPIWEELGIFDVTDSEG